MLQRCVKEASVGSACVAQTHNLRSSCDIIVTNTANTPMAPKYTNIQFCGSDVCSQSHVTLKNSFNPWFGGDGLENMKIIVVIVWLNIRP